MPLLSLVDLYQQSCFFFFNIGSGLSKTFAFELVNYPSRPKFVLWFGCLYSLMLLVDLVNLS